MGIVERRLREKEQRQNDIIDAAERVFFSKGMETATMDDVAQEAELSKGTLYLYFNTKEDLYLAIHLRGVRIMDSMFQNAVARQVKGLDQVLAIGRAYFDFFLKHPNYFNALSYYETRDLDFQDEDSLAAHCAQQGHAANQLLVEAIQRGIQDGSIRPEIDPIKLAVILWGQTTGLLQVASRKKEIIRQFYGTEINELYNYYVQFMRQAMKA